MRGLFQGQRIFFYIFILFIGLFIHKPIEKIITLSEAPSYLASFANPIIITLIVLLGIILFELCISLYPRWKNVFLKNEFLIYKIIIGLLLLLALIIPFSYPIGGDVVEHAHAGFLVYHGYVPFVDFFEHHNPLYYYVISPFFALEGILPIYCLFILSFIALCLSSLFLFRIGQELFKPKRYSYLMVIYFLSFKNVLFSYVRPDRLSVLFLLIAVFYLVKKKNPEYFKIGLFCGISFLFLQKTIFYMAGICLLIIFLKKKLFVRNILTFISGAAVPITVFLLFFYTKAGMEGVWTYYLLNFTYNKLLNPDYAILERLTAYAIANGAHVILAIGGLIILAKRKQLLKMPQMLLLCLVNLGTLLFFIIKQRINITDFLYIVPFFSITAIPAMFYVKNKIPRRLEPYLITGGLFLLILPIALTMISIVAIPTNIELISFYVENHKGEESNCGLIFNPLHQYNFNRVDEFTHDFLQSYNIPSRILDVEDFIEKKYPLICTNNPAEAALLSANNYSQLEINGRAYNHVFIAGA